MALDREMLADEARTKADLDRSVVASDEFYEPDTGRSNFAAFLLGGFVIAGGLLGFLYYDNDDASRRDGLTTGSLRQIESTAPPAVSVPMAPRPEGSSTAP